MYLHAYGDWFCVLTIYNGATQLVCHPSLCLSFKLSHPTSEEKNKNKHMLFSSTEEFPWQKSVPAVIMLVWHTFLSKSHACAGAVVTASAATSHHIWCSVRSQERHRELASPAIAAWNTPCKTHINAWRHAVLHWAHPLPRDKVFVDVD